MLHIFLAHASEDKLAVTRLYHRLKENGYIPWLDQEDLLPGQDWKSEIRKAIKESDVFIACLSKQSVAKQGYVQKEFKMALNLYAEKPSDSIYLIPVRLDECHIPELRQDEYGVSLRNIHWLDFFSEDGFELLLKTLKRGFPDHVTHFADAESFENLLLKKSLFFNDLLTTVRSVFNKGDIFYPPSLPENLVATTEKYCNISDPNEIIAIIDNSKRTLLFFKEEALIVLTKSGMHIGIHRKLVREKFSNWSTYFNYEDIPSTNIKVTREEKAYPNKTLSITSYLHVDNESHIIPNNSFLRLPSFINILTVIIDKHSSQAMKEDAQS